MQDSVTTVNNSNSSITAKLINFTLRLDGPKDNYVTKQRASLELAKTYVSTKIRQ